MIIGDISGISGWDPEAANATIQSSTRIPTGCVLGRVTHYAMFGFDDNDFVINKKIARHLRQTLPKSYLEKAVRVIE
jgi:hypothetical protein